MHGLHYVGDKLGLLARALTWLTADGLFLANLDLASVCFTAPSARRLLRAFLHKHAIEYDARRRVISCRGARTLTWPAVYRGADERAGPNYTGQPAVESHYEWAQS